MTLRYNVNKRYSGVNMTGLEIFLIIIGLIFVVCSYLFSEHLESKSQVRLNIRQDTGQLDLSEVRDEMVQEQIGEEVNNIAQETLEKTESMLDKVSNEKIMELSDYSDKVLEEIKKTHSEVMFLYNMLGDKELDIKNTIKEFDILKNNVKNMIEENKGKEMSGIDETESAQDLIHLNTEKDVNGEETEGQFFHKEVILSLFNQGKSIMQIAKELGLGIGEVRLVVDLFNASAGNGSKEEA